MQWEPVIGLEVHVQLNTDSKIFSGAATQFGAAPNTQACAIDLGLPGTLPVLNEMAVHKAIKFGLAVNAQINQNSIFERKNYFYPDLPKGYQISQFEHPIVMGGQLIISAPNVTPQKIIQLTRAHLEEDAGKSLHEDFHGQSGIDLNRAGTPLLEIVSEPELRSAQEAVDYLKALHTLVKYLDICDGNLQEGSFRCDANVSVRPKGSSPFGTRTEIKNINSFKFVEKAIEYEIDRQIDVLEQGGTITQETRLFDVQANVTRAMRSKEEAHDYRYFPDPDLLPVQVTSDTIQKIRATLPELPLEKVQRFISNYQLSPEDAAVLTSSLTLADYFEATVKASNNAAKQSANWILSELLGKLNQSEQSIEDSPIPPKQLGLLIQRIADNTISGKIAKTVFSELWEQEGTVDTIIERKNLKQVVDTGAIEAWVNQVIEQNPSQVEEYRAGKHKLMGFFVGQIMKLSQGKVNPGQVNALLKNKLDTENTQ